MLETIISGLVLAAVSGLAFLAYKHHPGYLFLIKWIRIVAYAIFALLMSYEFGFTAGKYTGDQPRSYSFGWVAIGLIGFFVYSGILDFLPYLTGKHGKEDKQKPPPPEEKRS